jgi:small-conductance mechanosensitive channel
VQKRRKSRRVIYRVDLSRGDPSKLISISGFSIISLQFQRRQLMSVIVLISFYVPNITASGIQSESFAFRSATLKL